MILTLLNKKFKKVNIVDEFISLMWCVRYNDIGALDLQVDATVENLNKFQVGYYITREDDEHIFVIDAIEVNTDAEGNSSLIVGATDLIGVLNRRVITKTLALDKTIKRYIQDLLENECSGNRSFGELVEIEIDDELNESTIGYRRATRSYVGDEVFKVLKESDLHGVFYYDFSSLCFKLKLTAVKDRTIYQKDNIRVLFSVNNDNLISSKYNNNLAEFKTNAFVYKENLSSGVFAGEEISGMDRREVIQESQASEEENVDFTYEGNQLLLDLKTVSSFEGEVDTNYYKYKEDYNVGDVVSFQNNFGVSASAKIIEVIETWDDNGYTIEPVFEVYDESVNFDDLILTEDIKATFTENVEVLRYETSPLIDEVTTDYILSEDGLLIEYEEL